MPMNLIDARVAGVKSFAEFIVETIAMTVEQVPRAPAFSLLLQEATIARRHKNFWNAKTAAVARAHFKPGFDAARTAGELRNGIEFEQFMDWIMHISAPLLQTPPAQCDARRVRQMLWRFLVPPIIREEAIPLDKRG